MNKNRLSAGRPLRFRILLLTLLLLAAISGSVLAESAVDFTEASEFAFAETLEGFCAREDCSIRAVYAITLPDDPSSVHEAVLESYAGYSDILLIEFGWYRVSPIVESYFVCVGTSEATGSLAILPSPSVIIGRTYDYNAFDNVSIVPVA